MKTAITISGLLFTALHLVNGLRDVSDEGELVFTSILYRHGERTPQEPYPNDPYNNLSYWPGGWGMLTAEGKRHHYHLGKWLRERYTSLIPDGKYSHDLIYVQSTDMDRTLMSALSNLAGMFYPTDEEIWSGLTWQPIPVHTIPNHLDKVLYMGFPCPKYDQILESLEELKKYNEQNKYLYQYITENTGEQMDSLKKIRNLYTTLLIERMNNFTLPKWTNSVFPDRLYQVATYELDTHAMTKELKRLKGGPLLKEIITHMKQKRDKTLSPDRNLWVYSAHDVTTAILLNTMGVFEPHMPIYAATIMVELRRNRNKQYFVSVYYKNSTEEPELLTIPGCSPSCPLDTFESLLSDVIPGAWDQECQISDG